jgi:hypothetical protein
MKFILLIHQGKHAVAAFGGLESAAADGAKGDLRGLQVRAAFIFTIERDRIAGIDLVMEPEHLAALDVRSC